MYVAKSDIISIRAYLTVSSQSYYELLYTSHNESIKQQNSVHKFLDKHKEVKKMYTDWKCNVSAQCSFVLQMFASIRGTNQLWLGYYTSENRR